MGRNPYPIVGLEPIVEKDDPSELPDLLTLAEAAEQLRCSAKHLRDHVVIGDLPHYKVGRGYKVAKCDLVRWARSRRVANHA